MNIGPDYRGERMVFVLGCPRSGTTWVQRLLSCHPRVRTGQESNLFIDSIGLQLRRWRRGLSLKERSGVGLACYFTEPEMLELLREFMLKLLQRMLGSVKDGEIFVDKTPDHALYLSEIFEMLPASRIIHVIRDPRDVVASLIAASRGWASESLWAPRSAREGAKLWMKSVDTVRKTVKNTRSKQLLQVRYEDLYDSGIPTLRRIAEFVGLVWTEEEMLEVLKANRFASGVNGNQPSIPLSGQAALAFGPRVIDPEGFLRKGKPGSWKSDLSPIDKFWVWKLAHECARENGYRIGWFR
jgi:hypothetical protein